MRESREIAILPPSSLPHGEGWVLVMFFEAPFMKLVASLLLETGGSSFLPI